MPVNGCPFGSPVGSGTMTSAPPARGRVPSPGVTVVIG